MKRSWSTVRSGPEAGKFNDRLMAYMIGKQVASLMPVKRATKRQRQGYQPRDPVTGYGFIPPVFLLSLFDKF